MLHEPPSTFLRSPIEHYLQSLHERHAGLDEGDVARYIPELAKADAGWFGICIATRDGHVYSVGDTRRPFTIQSISKALSYGLALEDRGEEHILKHISVEPSGDAFNAISLKPDTGAPYNPMINAGAIATCGQIQARDGMSRIGRILAYLSACAGRPLEIDRAVYESESATGHRNRAIGWMLRNAGIIDEEPTEILETYFQQCAIQVTCRDLALMGATLANNGCNPLTGEQAIAPEYVDNVLAVMASCGMYDFSGEWLYRIGLPAKSGVGGGILAVQPGQLGIGVFSPPLDAQGNSARGIRVCADLAKDLALHLFSASAAPQPSLRLSFDGSQVSSCRRRTPRLQQMLRDNGHRIRVVELQGELNFSTFEPVLRLVLEQAKICRYLILNLRNVVGMDAVSVRLMAELQGSLRDGGVDMVVCDAERLRDGPLAQAGAGLVFFPDSDAALEYCENALLHTLAGADWNSRPAVALGDAALFSGLAAADLAWLDGEMGAYTATIGDFLIRAGDAGDCLYVLLSGTVEVRLPDNKAGGGKRVDVFVAGMSLGEMGFLEGLPRSADVIALEPCAYRVIHRGLFERLGVERPGIKIFLLEQMALQLAASLRRANAEVTAFRG